MKMNLLRVAMIAALTGTVLSLRRRAALRRARERAEATPVPVERWEGEGGALPKTGSQMGPDPSRMPTRSSTPTI